MLYHIIVIKITYSICLLVFRSTRKKLRGLSRLITKKKTLVAAYFGLLYSVCHPEEWDVPDFVRSVIVNPPIWRKQAGRPRTTRIPSTGEKKDGALKFARFVGK